MYRRIKIPVFRGFLRVLTRPTRGSGQGGFKMSPFGSGHHCVVKSYGSGRVRSRSFLISRVGSGRVKRFQNITDRAGSGRAGSGRIKRFGNLAGRVG